ncbi:hypothetical protein [Hymenobacter saemangeumensis]
MSHGPLLSFRFNGSLTRVSHPIIVGSRITSENMWNNANQLHAGYWLTRE